MTTTSATTPATTMFAHARSLSDHALPLLEQGDVRNSAENAFQAIKRAADALILVRTGKIPPEYPENATGTALLWLLDDLPEARPIQAGYSLRHVLFHGDIFLIGFHYEPHEIEGHVRKTSDYIDYAEALAFDLPLPPPPSLY